MNSKPLLQRLALFGAVIMTVVGLAMAANGPHAAQAVGKPELRRALLGTVRVAVPIETQKDSYSTGSGTVLTADGYILTNFHVMGDKQSGRLYNQKGLAFIAVNPSDLKSLPTWLYQAQFVKGDAKLDLALLKIVAPFKGGGTLPRNLGLTPLPIGDSDAVEIADAVHVIGFPGIGGDSVTYTSGTIAGFLDEDGDRVIDWFKTDAEVNHGNSGGLAINDAGEMIGIPTAGYTEKDSTGKISLLRPVGRALALIKAAVVQGGGSAVNEPTSTSTTARITRLVFSDSVDANNRPGKTATAFPAGTVSVYAVFEFEGFKNGQKFQGVWLRDGKQDVVSSIDWDGGSSGSYWISIVNQKGIIEGAYDLIISLDGVQLYKARMSVGGQAQPTPTSSRRFGTPTFAEGVTASNDPVRPHTRGESFPEGITQIYAFATYQNMEDGLTWSYVWYVDGEQVLRRDRNWQFGANGTFWVSVTNKNGLPNGQYRLELYIDDQLAAQAQTSVGAGGRPLATDEGVQVIGTVLDADTRRPIAGAMFLVLQPGIDAESFLADPKEADVYAGGETDSKGQFTLDAELERGETYAVVAAARGYQPAYENDFTIDDSTESPLEVRITLQKR